MAVPLVWNSVIDNPNKPIDPPKRNDRSMKNAAFISSVLSATLLLIGNTPGSADAQEDKPVLPKTWDEFVEFYQNCGAFGTFVTEGETKNLWEGIDAGQKYRASYTLSLSPDQKTIHASHRMETESGDVISIGVGVQYWNAKTNKVMSSYSGFDQGKLFTGQSKLGGMNFEDQVIQWTYVEKSQGKTNTYKQEITQTSPNAKFQMSKKKSGGESWSEELTRVTNRGKENSRGKWLPKLLRRQK